MSSSPTSSEWTNADSEFMSMTNTVPATPYTHFEPGTYMLTNMASGTVMDLSGGDNKSIIGFPGHEGGNQKWNIERLGSGYSVRSVSTGLYITVEAGIRESVPLVASQFPVSWDIQVNEERGAVRFSWPNAPFAWDMSYGGDPTPGTKVQLWGEDAQFAPCRWWKLTKLMPVISPLANVESISRPKAPNDHGSNLDDVEVIVTTTVTETTTKTTTMTEKKSK